MRCVWALLVAFTVYQAGADPMVYTAVVLSAPSCEITVLPLTPFGAEVVLPTNASALPECAAKSLRAALTEHKALPPAGSIKDMAQVNIDPLCEFPLLAALPAAQAALRQGGVP